MRRAGSFLLVIAMSLAAGGAVLAVGEDQTLYEEGRNAVFEERWKDARRIFEDLTRRYPQSAHSDDSRYWLGMSFYEMGDPEQAYAILKELNTLYPDSPWSDDSRVLMVRCAEAALRRAVDRAAPGGLRADRPADPRSEYRAFIEKSTRDASARVQVLAIDTMLGTNPGRAPELLPRLSGDRTSREAADLVLDRFFGGDRVKVTLESPMLGLRDGNVAIMVRQNDRITYLSLSEATDLLRGTGTPPRFDPSITNEVREKLLQAERNLVREGDPGTVETIPGLGSRNMSAIIKVVDGEVHYYRHGDETVRILVLRREAGFTEENIRIFTEIRGNVRQIGLAQARSLSPAAPASGAGPLSEATVRYLKAALAILEIDLSRKTGAATR